MNEQRDDSMKNATAASRSAMPEVKDRFHDFFRSAAKSPLVSKDEQTVLKSIESLEYWLDDKYRVPGTGIRFGWDTILGLVPGAGDVLTAGIATYIVWNARRLNISRWTQMRMMGNIGLDFLIGAVPLVGDMFDVAFKANRKNLRLIRKELNRKRPTV